MPKMINLMVACAENRVMGRKNRLPWRIPEDMRFFHEQTAGKTIILGRICYQTWPRAREDGRRLIVVTSDASLERDGVRVARSVPEALEIAEAMPGEIYVNGYSDSAVHIDLGADTTLSPPASGPGNATFTFTFGSSGGGSGLSSSRPPSVKAKLLPRTSTT